jgi:protein ImuB
MRRILCLYLPNWPIQRVLAGRNGGEGPRLPLLLHARDPRRGEIVVACNAAAAERGVRPGLPLAEAVVLASHQRSASADVLPHDPAADLAELARLAEHCERFSPLVGWETVTAEVQSSRFQVPGSQPSTGNLKPGTWNSLFLDITGIGVLFGGEDKLAAAAVTDLARFGYTARAAVADTIAAAWAWASERSSPPLAPSPESLAPLPLSALRLPPETLELLAQLGLTRLDELLALPRASLRARFGERLLQRLDQLTGAAQETIVPYRPPPKFAAEWVLEYPAERREIIEQILHELVGRIARSLAERREGVVQLLCRLDCAPGNPVQLTLGLFRPSADARHLWDLVRMQLEQTSLPGPIGRATLSALTTAPLENRQGQLFAGGQDEADRQLGLLIDRLASRLGPDAVLCPQLTSDPLPERAVSQRSGVRGQESRGRQAEGKRGARNSERRTKTRDQLFSEPRTLAPESALFRPLFLRPPVVLEVTAVVPDGPPVTFRYQGRQHRVAFHWGPERIETGWWRGASIRRDYYRVQTDEGLRFWLFRRLDDERWCLHGSFD